MAVLEFIGGSLLFLLFLATSLAITVPLTGTLVRLRANFNPKSLQLNLEEEGGGAEVHAGPVINSFITMFQRVKRLEGWSGLYKGLMPTLISNAFLVFFALIVFDSSPPRPRGGTYHTPATGAWGTLLYSFVLMLVSLPGIILTYRAITTPQRLPYFAPMRALRVLLTPTERARPWVLYLTPGLLVAETAHIAYVVLGLRALKYLMGLGDSAEVWRHATFYAVVAVSTAILSPLEVVSTRLAVQRNHAGAGYDAVAQEAEDEAIEYAGAEEDVIGLRAETDPYLGFVDCVQKIVREEGWTALYRGWGLTLVFAVFGSFS